MNDKPAMDNFSGKYTGPLLFMLCVGVGIGFLSLLHRDLGVGAAIIAVYSGLYWLYRKTLPPKPKTHYPLMRYRGHGPQKKKFFS